MVRIGAFGAGALARLWVCALGIFLAPPAFAGADSYRWLHVTIDAPWAIFLFLLPMVLFPVVLMAFLYWRVAVKRAREGAAAVKNAVPETPIEKPSEV